RVCREISIFNVIDIDILATNFWDGSIIEKTACNEDDQRMHLYF
nr:hypothetical protein [Tanacetum cinerariifolium]